MSESQIVNPNPEANFPVSVDHSEWDSTQRQLSALRVDLSVIPVGWFLDGLSDSRSWIKGRYQHLRWTAELQHESGGKLTIGEGGTPQGAIESAIFKIRKSNPH